MKTALNNTKFTHYIALYDQGTVYGTGATRAQCIADARQWADNLNGIDIYDATEAAYDYAKRLGGDARLRAVNVNPHRLEVSLAQAA